MRRIIRVLFPVLLLWAALTMAAGFALPDQLLKGPVPSRTEVQRENVRVTLAENGSRWTKHEVSGGEGVPLEVWWLHRVHSNGVAIIPHGFGDDAWGSATRAWDLPEWDAVVFTFRGRDRHPDLTVVHGAGHCEAGGRIQGGWKAWADARLSRWGI